MSFLRRWISAAKLPSCMFVLFLLCWTVNYGQETENDGFSDSDFDTFYNEIETISTQSGADLFRVG